MVKLLSVTEAAERLGVHPSRVRALAGGPKPRLVGTKVGRDWVFEEAVVEAFAQKPRHPGRPKGEDGLVQVPH